MEKLENVQPVEVFKFFKEVSNIPRGSGNEKEISNYLVKFANKRNLEVIQDEFYNVIIKKEATNGYENSPTLILQAHIDMVCEKNSDTKHDFTKDPIKILVEGDFIKADGTTLGADNGIGVAYFLAILDSKEISHPKLEVVFTVEEETTMKGAKTVDVSKLNGKTLLSLDHVREGELLVGCAGLIKVGITKKLKSINIPDDFIGYKIKVGGLVGGHSGLDIALGKGNSNCLMGRLLRAFVSEFDVYISNMIGGLKANAIPRENEAILFIKEENKEKLEKICDEYNQIYKQEFKGIDSDVYIDYKLTEGDSIPNMLNKDSTTDIISFLTVCPNGVQSFDKNIEGLPESSLNVGVVNFKDNMFLSEITIRNNVKSKGYEILGKLEYISKRLNMNLEVLAESAALEYKENSRLRDVCIKLHKQMYNKESKITQVHAIVEGGVFSDRISAIDILSIAPDLFDIHSPSERLSISSTQRTWEYVKRILEELK